MEFLKSPENLIDFIITIGGLISIYIRLNNKIIILEEYKKNSTERILRRDNYDSEFRKQIKTDIDKILDKLDNIKNAKN